MIIYVVGYLKNYIPVEVSFAKPLSDLHGIIL